VNAARDLSLRGADVVKRRIVVRVLAALGRHDQNQAVRRARSKSRFAARPRSLGSGT
jgi:hypothetical protein